MMNAPSRSVHHTTNGRYTNLHTGKPMDTHIDTPSPTIILNRVLLYPHMYTHILTYTHTSLVAGDGMTS